MKDNKDMEVLKQNEIMINDNKYEIKLIKMKYLKEGFYGYHKIIKETGLVKLISRFSDGEDILKIYLKGVFDSQNVADEIIEHLDAKKLSEIISKTSTLNEIIDDEEEKNVI